MIQYFFTFLLYPKPFTQHPSPSTLFVEIILQTFILACKLLILDLKIAKKTKITL
jgi:hypothetical protein